MYVSVCRLCDTQATCSGSSLLPVTLNWISKRRRMDRLIKTLNDSCTVMLKLKKIQFRPNIFFQKLRKKISFYFLSAAFIYYHYSLILSSHVDGSCRMMQLAVVPLKNILFLQNCPPLTNSPFVLSPDCCQGLI